LILVFFIESVLKARYQFEGALDVTRLCRFVSSTKENDDFLMLLHKVHAVSWAKVKAHFAHASSDRSDVTRVSLSQPVDARSNLCFCPLIAKL